MVFKKGTVCLLEGLSNKINAHFCMAESYGVTDTGCRHSAVSQKSRAASERKPASHER
jgi:hypothetical protein